MQSWMQGWTPFHRLYAYTIWVNCACVQLSTKDCKTEGHELFFIAIHCKGLIVYLLLPELVLNMIILTFLTGCQYHFRRILKSTEEIKNSNLALMLRSNRERERERDYRDKDLLFTQLKLHTEEDSSQKKKRNCVGQASCT